MFSLFATKMLGPVSLPSHISKIFERPLYKQIETFMSKKHQPSCLAFVKTIIHNIAQLIN